MKRFQLINNIVGFIVFAIAATVYLLTIEPTASFWDCGEFISTAFKLEVGHPPGAPFFMLMARFFTLFASDVHEVAKMVNVFSAMMSALTILFLFWTITHLSRRLLVKTFTDDAAYTTDKVIKIIGSGVVGALAYTFSDTFWFSAVEAEVYASSSMFTAVVFWAMLKWEDVADEPYANRWLVLIAYLMGLSIAVHLLNLLCIPALVLVYYFRKYEATGKGTCIALLLSFAILVVILYGVIPGFVTMAGWFELFFVNTLGFSFNVGTIIYCILLISCLVYGIYITMTEAKGKDRLRAIVVFVVLVTLLGIPFFGSHVKMGICLIALLSGLLYKFKDKVQMPLLNTIVLCLTVILLGYASPYTMLIIRSSANPPMDQNSPDDVFALKSYLNRDQYGDTPLFYGESYASEYLRDRSGNVVFDEGEPLYAKKIKENESEPDSYVQYDTKKQYKYQPQFLMLFPRMYSRQPSHVQAYKSWAGIKGKKVKNNSGKYVIAPTFAENLTYFFRYQVGFMYCRYFMWNFVGRQNDIQGHGEVTNGNWISGIDFIDELHVGDQEHLPDVLKNNKGRNVYYFLPFILGLLGIVYQFGRGKRGMQSFYLVLALFFMTGLAIVVYLNQYPFQPRERDYAYAGSFYAYCIWIGLGVMLVSELIEKVLDKRVAATIASILCLGVPTLMAQQNWDDHDRSNRYTCRDYGANYLLGLAPNAVIFTNGDNDTFPLWYNQEVEGCRTDVRVANLSYLQMAWYVDQMQSDAYDSPALPLTMQPKHYSNGKLDVAYLDKNGAAMDLNKAFDGLLDPSLRNPEYRDEYDILPSAKFTLPVDASKVREAGIVSSGDSIVSQIELDLTNKRYLGKHELFILDLLRSNKDWKRPIYFAATVGKDSYTGLGGYLQQEGIAYRVVPTKDSKINTDIMYDNMMNKFKWGNVKQEGIYMDENTSRMSKTYRHMFLNLADALMKEGKTDKAKAAIDKCMEEIPLYNVPVDYVAFNFSRIYRALGEKDKANAISDEVVKTWSQYKTWFEHLDREKQKSAADDISDFMWMMGSLAMSEDKGVQERYADECKLFTAFYEKYSKFFDR